jgi:uncharacterized membrane protein
MISVTVYIKENDPKSTEIVGLIEEINKELPFQPVIIDISSDSSIYEKYKEIAPLVIVGPYQLKVPISKQDLRVAIHAAADRQEVLKTDKGFQKKVDRGNQITGTDRFTLWLSNYYLYFLNLLLLVYIGTPFLAPVLEENKLEGAAKVIYTMYSPVCHQLAYRSWFLFGEQPYYPRALAQVADVKTYEEVTGADPANLLAGRQFVGNPTLGYKVAICERDVAIYGTMLLFGILFLLTGRRIKAIPWYIWVGIGMIPMGIDGGSQLFSFAPGLMPAWVPIRESTPFLRTLTGALFGITTMWYVLPIIEESMRESRSFILRKIAVIKSKAVPEK